MRTREIRNIKDLEECIKKGLSFRVVTTLEYMQPYWKDTPKQTPSMINMAYRFINRRL